MLPIIYACLSLSAVDAVPPILAAPSALIYPRELKDPGLAVAVAGEYQVWVWAQAGVETTLSVGGQSLKAPAPDRRKVKRIEFNHGWVKAGAVKLPAGAVEITVSEGVFAVAVSSEGGYEPESVAADICVLRDPVAVEDARVKQTRHTDTVFMMPQYTRESWEAKAEVLRRRMALACGLTPMPEAVPLNAKIFDRIEHEDYTVEKVHFEVTPGFLCTGNLYRPKGKGPFPAVVNPHGHWTKGRLEDTEDCSVPGRCITLARMGAVAFTYDMVGYNDSRQFPDHRWVDDREKLWGVHPFAIQLMTSLRAVDFVSSLEEVDPERIGCTGASGGGTQTFALFTVDPRVKVAAPVNMISSTMQGGCICENAPLIRYDNSNMEVGALMAPRPLLMVAATGDWTRETPRVEYPAIRSIYALYGAEDKVACAQFDYGHNYNKESRTAVYRFFGKHLIDPARDWSGFTEPAFTKDPDDKLQVFPGKGVPDGLKGNKEIIEELVRRNRDKWAAVLPADAAGVDAFRARFGSIITDVLGVEIPAANDVRAERTAADDRDTYILEHWILSRKGEGDAVPALLFRNADPARKTADDKIATLLPQDAVLLTAARGKQAFVDMTKGGPGPLVAALLAQGKAVLAIDTFLTGEHNAPDACAERIKVGAFLDTFEPTDAACRVQDILTATAFLHARRDLSGRVTLGGLGDAGLWCLFAAAADPGIAAVAADLNQFPLEDDAAWVDRCYIPCIRSVGDVRTALALVSGRPCALYGAADGAGGLAWLGAAVSAGAPSEAALAEALR